MSYLDLLKTVASDVKPAKAVPQGIYEFVITGPHEMAELGKEKTPFATFPVRIVAPIEVDETELDEFGESPAGRNMRLRFAVTELALPRLSRFLVEHLELDESLTLEELLAEAVNQRFGGLVTHSISNKEGDDTIYANVDKTVNLNHIG